MMQLVGSLDGILQSLGLLDMPLHYLVNTIMFNNSEFL